VIFSQKYKSGFYICCLKKSLVVCSSTHFLHGKLQKMQVKVKKASLGVFKQPGCKTAVKKL
jgi:hypothetical protein